jgi:hypothetical protein
MEENFGREAGAGGHFLAPLDDLVCVVAVLVVSLVASNGAPHALIGIIGMGDRDRLERLIGIAGMLT